VLVILFTHLLVNDVINYYSTAIVNFYLSFYNLKYFVVWKLLTDHYL